MQLTEPVLMEAVAAMARGEAVAFATVVSVSGSTPRHLGARMAASTTSQWGTIGGGRVEQEVVAGLRRTLQTGVGGYVEHHLVRDLAMCCGGSMGFALTLAAPSALALQAAVAGLRNGTGGQLQTAVDGSGFRFIAEPDALPNQPRVRDGMLCEPIGVPPRAIVFGVGHVARALGPLAHAVGFNVVVCDDGETNVHDEPMVTPAWASRLIESFDPREVAHTLGGFGRNDYILIVTRDHAVDQRILEALIDEPSGALVGMIGSRGKVARFRKRLLAKGLIATDDDPRWLRIVAPIGLDIGAETPPEIAVAVVAQLVAHYRTGRTTAGQWLPR